MEFEKKGLISKEEFELLLEKCHVLDSFEQVNYYFDTDDQYFKNNSTSLRVRFKKDTYELTLKLNKGIGNVEYNFPITEEDFLFIKEKRKTPDILREYVADNLILNKLAIITTKRHIIPFEKHFIELDLNYFKDITDYEIEVEGQNMQDAECIFLNFTKMMDIHPNVSFPKIKRYYMYNKNVE